MIYKLNVRYSVREFSELWFNTVVFYKTIKLTMFFQSAIQFFSYCEKKMTFWQKVIVGC